MPTAVIVDAIRTPLGKRNGKLEGLAPGRPRRRDAEGARRAQRHRPRARRRRRDGLRDAGRRAGASTSPATPCSPPAGPRRCPARPIDRQCGSRQQAAHFAAQGVIAGAYDVVVAAGVEVMTRVPMGASMVDGKFGFPFGPKVERALRADRAASCRRASRPS